MPYRYDPALAPLLEEAAVAYRNREDERFAELLRRAIAVAPQRVDLRHCLANKHIQTGRPELARDIYQELHDAMPGDIDTLFLLAHWRRCLGETAEADALRWHMARLRPDRAVELARIWDAVDGWLARPVRADLPAFAESVRRPAVVVLGHKLAEDGSILPPLQERLDKALEAANRYPDAALIVSGGLPRAGRVEAQAMRAWLAERGVDEARIHEEGYARDTVENLIFSLAIARLVGADAVVAVTSAYNVRRAGAALEVLAGNDGADWPVHAVAGGGDVSAAFKDDGADRLKVYRDVLRAYGVPMMAAYPHLAER